MGCASSKTTPPRCRHCKKSYSSPAISRSYSMHVHHPPQNRGDSYHVVALTSSTLGSLNNNRIEYEIKTIANELDHHIHMLKKETTNKVQDLEVEKVNENENVENTKEFSMGLIEAKTWSNMINQKIPKIIPKTPTRTPPGEPEMIDAWELMEGLEDTSPIRYSSHHHLRSFSFDVVKEPCPVSESDCVVVDRPKSRFSVALSPPQQQPMWLQCEKENLNSNLQFDPEVISGFRKSFEELKNDDPFHFSEVDTQKQQNYLPFSDDMKEVESVVSDNESEVLLPFGKGKDSREKVVLYFTSLRGVRKTYEDCCHVRVILKGLGVRVDERDVSMHSGFKEELKKLVNVVSLPKVFLGDKCIGGVEEIRQLHEEGKLEKLLESCEKLSDGCGGGGGACDACGDIRFVPCETCSGSCKIYYEDEDRDQYESDESDEGREEEEEDEEEEAKEGEGGFQRCPNCNENGLIRCPICCY